MATTGSVGGLLVWASQCLAFIQYRKWSVQSKISLFLTVYLYCTLLMYHLNPRLHIHKDKLLGRYFKYNRWQSHGNENRYTSVLSIFQPIVAWLGMTGCLLIVFVFNSANWWSTEITVQKVAIAYAGVSSLLLNP
jgi:amino acid transporter